MRFFLALLVASALYADDDNKSDKNDGNIISRFETLPDIVLHSVNVISGQYVETEKDMRIVCPVPLTFERSKQQNHYESNYLGGWNCNLGEEIEFQKYHEENGQKRYKVFCTMPHNEKLFFGNHKTKSKFKGLNKIDPSQFKEGITNCSGSQITGQKNHKNITLEYFRKENEAILTEEDGTKKVYRENKYDNLFLDLENEYLPTGNYLKHKSSTSFSKEVRAFNSNHEELGWIKYEFINSEQFMIKGSDGRNIIYKYKTSNVEDNPGQWRQTGHITYVNRPDGPPISYSYYTEYPKTNLIKRKDLPDSRYSEYKYYGLNNYGNPEGKDIKVKSDSLSFRRVRELSAPLGTDYHSHRMYTFWYYDEKPQKNHYSAGRTLVHDAYGRKRMYRYQDNRLIQIEFYQDDNNTRAYTENITWGEDEENINIKSRSIINGDGSLISEKCYFYDTKHNPIRETIRGNWLGYGHHNDVQTTNKTFTNSVHNLPVTETNEQGTVYFTYYHDRNLIRSKIFRGNDGITFRQFFYYDKNAILSCEILDDGTDIEEWQHTNVTERKIKRITSNRQGLPVEVCEFYVENGQEIFKSKEINIYSPIGRLIKHEFYGSDNLLAYTEEWDYDEKGNVTRERNGLGYEVLREYDFNGNLTRKIGPSPTQDVSYAYDYMNRLIRIDEKVGESLLNTHYGYDFCGNRIFEIDPMGHKTEYAYNNLNQRIKRILPNGAIISCKLDPLGHVIEETDGEGHKSYVSYTLSGKPYLINYPDGSCEKMNYDYKGNLVKKVDKNGLITVYERDSLGRILSTSQFDGQTLLSRTSATFNTFHLLTETDAAGVVTHYCYNAAGQKIKEAKGNKIIEFSYDSLGKLSQIKADDLITSQKHDILDRLIEEKIETIDGTILSLKKKAYDEEGRLLTTLTLSERGYDVEEFKYNSKGELVEATNALNQTTFHSYDYTPQGLKHTVTDPSGCKLVTLMDCLGRIILYERQNPYSETLQKRIFTYDKNNNKIKAVETVYNGKEPVREITTLWGYDKLNHVISLTDAANTPEQKKTSTIYNDYGQKWKIIKPDGVILEHKYDLLGRVVALNSSDQSIQMTFAYDVLNNVIQTQDKCITVTRQYDGKNLIKENYEGLNFYYAYDSYDRLITLTYPDKSYTSYTYKGGRIDTITRKDQITSYSYNLNGKPSIIHHFDGSETKIEYDALSRETKISAPFYIETLTYDVVGNLIAKNNETYTYDDLNQLTSENNHLFTHDSRYNCTSHNDETYTYNSLDQPSHLSYDLNGNLISQNDLQFKYDALDRLVQVTKDNTLFTYTYDPFNRRLKNNEITYLYQGENEIGSISPNHTTLRILGVGKGAENSAAVSLELDNETYIPLHNTLGSIIQLRQNNTVVETITYTAFGETSTTSLSPWLYSSKRLDPESNLYYFGRRFYDPSTHRWITCDPKGYDGGPNLYSYVLNCPLTHIDLYGLIGVGASQTWAPAVGSFLTNLARLPGLTLELIGQHMIPVPLLRDVVEYSGHLLAGRGVNTYVPSYSRNHSEPIYIAGDESKNKTLHLQNGICTTRDEALNYAIEMQKKYGGIPVHLTYNGTKGFVTDLIECGMQKLGILTTPEKQFIKDINETAKSHGAGHTFLVIGHSQGGMIIGNSLRHLSPEIKANMHVRTMGSASIISNNEGLASIRNYVSLGDIVYLTDPWGIAKSLMGKSNVAYMKPQGFAFPDHFLGGNTYKLAEKFIQKDFNKINESK